MGNAPHCKIVEDMCKESYDEGFIEGLKERMAEIILNFIIVAMEHTNYSATQVMEAFNIPEADRAYYLEKL